MSKKEIWQKKPANSHYRAHGHCYYLWGNLMQEDIKKGDATGWRGAENGTRTHDLLITNELLYQLSYFGNLL